MSSQDNNNSDDFFMLDLFRSELETGAAILGQGLVVFERGESPENIDAVIRAAHSIKGAARIVAIDNIVSLASAMEDTLNSIRDGKCAFRPEMTTLLGEGIEIFRTVSEFESQDVCSEVEKKSATIDSLCSQIRALCIPDPDGRKKVESSQKAPEKKPAELLHDDFDTSMLDLFRVELENHSHILENGLVEIEDDSSPEKIEPLMRAAHSIKGAARIVNLNLEVSLAHAMEDVLSAAQHGNLTLTSEHIDILLSVNDIYKFIASLGVQEIHGGLVGQSLNVKKLTQSLIDILADKPFESSLQSALKTVSEPSDNKTDTQKDDLYVRVITDNMNRILSLTGESLVQAKSARSFCDTMLHMKEKQQEIASNIEHIMLGLRESNISDYLREKVTETSNMLEQCNDNLNRQIENHEIFSRHLENTAERLYNEVVSARMRPFSDGIRGFPRMVRDLAKKLGKNVNFVMSGESTRVDGDILENLESPLTHILRNAIDHGMETPEERIAAGKPAEGTILLEARHIYGMLNIIIKDDGYGINSEKIREKAVKSGQVSSDMAANLSDSELYDFMFLPGFSTQETVTEISGRGVGLDAVSAMLQTVGGNISIESERGSGTTFRLMLPLTLSVLPMLVVEINREAYALPLTKIDHVLEIPEKELHIVKNQLFCSFEDELIGVVSAQQILHMTQNENNSDILNIAIFSDRLSHRVSRHGLIIDRFIGQYDLVVRPLDPRFGNIPTISAGAILEDGSSVLILDIDDIVHSIDDIFSKGKTKHVSGKKKQKATGKKKILVVEDSLTVREVERKILQNKGYDVLTAVDGMDGWNKLVNGAFDLIISDVDMPRMTGIELVSKIKSDPIQKKLPVIIISYKDREEDRRIGLNAGADYYLTKASFHNESLLEAVCDLIGEP